MRGGAAAATIVLRDLGGLRKSGSYQDVRENVANLVAKSTMLGARMRRRLLAGVAPAGGFLRARKNVTFWHTNTTPMVSRRCARGQGVERESRKGSRGFVLTGF